MNKIICFGTIVWLIVELFFAFSVACAEAIRVHWNVDNDDSSDNALGSPKWSGGDFLQVTSGAVTGEDDLKLFTMSLKPDLNIGSMILTVKGDNASIWKSAHKGSENLILEGPGTKIWHLNDAEEKNEFAGLGAGVWIEGMGSGECEITLAFVDPYGNETCIVRTPFLFFSADCGRQPKTVSSDERSDAEAVFPHLVHCEWSITGEASPNYNCIAWSVGINNLWIGAIGPPEYGDEFIDRDYGNDDGVLQISDVDAFYAAKGLTTITSNISEASAIYYSEFHGARRKVCSCGDGIWLMFESKCGQWVRMEHPWEQLNGSAYGFPVRFYMP